MPKLHLKRMIVCLAIGSWFGFQSGMSLQKAVAENPVIKFVTTGKVF